MNAPSVLSDTQAREIAAALWPSPPFPLVRFVETGMIGPWLSDWATAGRNAGRARHDAADDLAAYVAFHGERGPVEGWSA